MARKLFGIGARGDLVVQIQRALAANGYPPGAEDGVYGEKTLDALVAYQGANRLDISGIVDETTWASLMQTPPPAMSERSLALTAALDGHDYTFARGNFDGGWLTWGIAGFSLRSGQVQRIVNRINARHPSLVTQAFGQHSAKLIHIMNEPAPAQKAWATSITVRNGNLAEPWRSGFARFGAFTEVRSEQRSLAYELHFRPALEYARQLGIGTELGFALLFDIQVQNGGLSAAAMEQVREDVSASHDATEINIREIVAEAAADDSIPKMREDVRCRKLTIARGQGTVRDILYDLSNWGLADLTASAVAVGV